VIATTAAVAPPSPSGEISAKTRAVSPSGQATPKSVRKEMPRRDPIFHSSKDYAAAKWKFIGLEKGWEYWTIVLVRITKKRS
jgi:hypothetical protein